MVDVDFQLQLKMFMMVMRGLFILLHRIVGPGNYMVRDLEGDYERFIAHPTVVDENERR